MNLRPADTIQDRGRTPGRAAPPAREARQQERMVRALARSLGADVVQTHISWILLAGERAWKIKKAVRMPFLDHRTLAAREQSCREELRLNRRLAGALYEAVEPVCGPVAAPVIGGTGTVIDWTVRMHRFPEHALAGTRLATGRLDAAEIDALVQLLGTFHLHAPHAPPSDGYGGVAQRLGAACGALAGCQAAMPQAEYRDLHRWMRDESQKLAPHWMARREQGFVRECHGDLHLDNLLLLPDGPAAFDCIEFDPVLRFIDIVDDIAFPVMDLSASGRDDLAFRLLNGWLDLTGDHDGLASLRFSVVYRALVRAHVSLLNVRASKASTQRYIAAAQHWCRAGAPLLTIMHGLPGSGKTTVSQRLLQQERAIRIRSDVERKRLFGLAAGDSSTRAHLDIYGARDSERTYAELFARARAALQAGFAVILDAAFLRRDERELARKLARELQAQFIIASCEAPTAELQRRLDSRRGDASEADVNVLRRLQAAAEPLAHAEQAFVHRIPTA